MVYVLEMYFVLRHTVHKVLIYRGAYLDQRRVLEPGEMIVVGVVGWTSV